MEDLKVHNKTANIVIGKYSKYLVWENLNIYAKEAKLKRIYKDIEKFKACVKGAGL